MKAYRVYDYYISFLPIVSLYNKYKSSLLTSFPTLTKTGMMCRPHPKANLPFQSKAALEKEVRSLECKILVSFMEFR